MTDTWLRTKEVADLEDVTIRAVRKKCNEGKYTTRITKSERGKAGYEILLSSLPPCTQQIYQMKKQQEEFEARLNQIPEKQRQIALERYNMLRAWEEFEKENSTADPDLFIREKLENKIARGTLYRWKKTFKENGIASLVPGWKNPRQAFGSDRFEPDAQDFVKKFYLSQNRPSIAAVFYELEKESRRRKWKIPSYETVRRFIARIPDGTRILEREGKKSFNDKVIPSMHRDTHSLRVNQVWVADHHQINIATLIRDGKDMKVIFPWLSGWEDMRTKKVTGWVLCQQPNSDTINLSLRDGIMRFGVPEETYVDNGKDYRAKLFMGGNKRFRVEMNEDKISGIYADLGIKPHFAIPYHAQSKPIERLFKRFDDQFAVHFRGYRGKNIQVRPEKLKNEIKKGNLLTFEQLKEKVHKWLELHYSQRPHRSLGMKSPDEVLRETSWVKRLVQEDELVLLMSAYPVMRKVQRDGIWFMNDWYWGEDIIPFFKKKVWIRYSENDPSKIYILDEKGCYAGIAHKRHKAYWGMEDKDYARHNRMKKAVILAHKGFVDPMPDTEREAIASSPFPGREEIFNPDVEEKIIRTKYGVMIEDAREKDERRKKVENEITKFDQQYALMEVQQKNIDAEVDEWALNYGRDIINEIKNRDTSN